MQKKSTPFPITPDPLNDEPQHLNWATRRCPECGPSNVCEARGCDPNNCLMELVCERLADDEDYWDFLDELEAYTGGAA